MNLKPNRGSIKSVTYNIPFFFEPFGQCYEVITHEYREFPFSYYYRHNWTVHKERKEWFIYVEQFEYISTPRRNRRCISNIPNTWDDHYSSAKGENPRSWKSHYKCRKQYMKNL